MPSGTARGTALVTGASSGIGAATARALAADGFDVIAAARRLDRLQALAAESERITPWELDVTDPGSVARLQDGLGDCDLTVLVANAGGSFDYETVATADLDAWQRAHDVNVMGTVRVVKELLPRLIASGRGTIVLMSSTTARVAYEHGGSYVAAKHAIAGLAGTLRLELCGEPVRVIEVAPGMVRTDEFSLNRFAGDAKRADAVYAGVDEPLTASDVADAVSWAVTRPHYVNVDLMVLRPLAQAAQHKVHRVT